MCCAVAKIDSRSSSVSPCQPHSAALGLRQDHHIRFFWQTWIPWWLHSSLSSSVVQVIISSLSVFLSVSLSLCVSLCVSRLKRTINIDFVCELWHLLNTLQFDLHVLLLQNWVTYVLSNTMATLIAVFHRLSQPSELICWSEVALIPNEDTIFVEIWRVIANIRGGFQCFFSMFHCQVTSVFKHTGKMITSAAAFFMLDWLFWSFCCSINGSFGVLHKQEYPPGVFVASIWHHQLQNPLAEPTWLFCSHCTSGTCNQHYGCWCIWWCFNLWLWL